MSKDITLVVMAAGMGSRFGGLKQMEPIGPNGEVLLDFSVYDAVKAGFTKVVFVIKHAIEADFKEMVGKRIAKRIKVDYVFQETDSLPDGYICPPDRTKPWGTAHAILCCRDAVKEPFAVVNADDYYGRSAFVEIAKFLQSDPEDYCMVGFRLINTLTENGYVSRGICETENGILKSVTERTKISDCKYTEDDGKTWTELAPDTIVSMNLWGFNTDFFGYIEKGFKAFLDEKIYTPKSEYYLPSVVSELIEKGEKQVKMLVAEDKWYGVTYKEDKQMVVDAIGKMINDGLYEGI
ncbi:MAG: NTP transferase domain-containing protein [Clostridia bacterium]|nr:NTP transferase domain-containing protein [Clostridia bacterium]